MRSTLSKSDFFHKMKKKPAVQEVLDNLDKYNEESINELSGPHFPVWIKEQLVMLKMRNGKTSQDVAKHIAQQMIEASNNGVIF